MISNIVSTTQIQRNIKEVLTALRASDEPMIVVRDSRPEAVMLSYIEYQRLKSLDKQLVKKKMEEVLRQMTTVNSKVTIKEIDKDIQSAPNAIGHN